MRYFAGLAAFLTCLCAASGTSAAPDAAPYDVLISGGSIYDGSGGASLYR